MLSVNYLVPFLLLLNSVRLHADSDCISPECLSKCMLDSTVSAGNHPVLAYKQKVGQIYEVMGLTRDCVFFTFIFGEKKFNATNPSSPNKYKGTGQCEGKRLMEMRTAGVNRKMVFIVDFGGRRIRIQSVFEAKSETFDGVTYLFPDVGDRRLHAYTQPLDRGYTIESMFNANYHVYILARNHYKFRIYELTVEMDSHLNLVPYLREESIDIDPALQPPFEAPEATVFHNMDMGQDSAFSYPLPFDEMNHWCGLAHGIEKLKQLLYNTATVDSWLSSHFNNPNNQDKETEKIAKDLMTNIWKGFEKWRRDKPIEQEINEKCEEKRPFYRQTTWGLALWQKHKGIGSLAIPYVSIMRGNSRGVNKESGQMSPLIRYYEKNGRFYLKRTECVAKMNYVMLYYNQLASTSTGYGGLSYNIYLTKRFFNEFSFHRRMSPPHSIPQRYEKYGGDGVRHVVLTFICVFLPLAGIFVVSAVVKCVSRMISRKKRGYSATNTHSH